MNIDYAKVYLRHSYHKPDTTSSSRWLGILRRAIVEGWLVPRDIMNSEQRTHRMHIRNAYLGESNADIDTVIAGHVTKQDWHAIVCLIELQLTP